MNIKKAAMDRCMRMGHDWAYNTSYTNQGFIEARCLRCNASQMFFLDEYTYDPNLDDDCSEVKDQ